MDKQKQIEEMAKIASVNCGECYTCDFCNSYTNRISCTDYFVANEFYKQGYRKIPEGSVVLTEEEFSEFRQAIINLSQEHTKKCDEMNDKIIKARKQAVKEFIEKLKSKMGEREYMGVKYKQGVFSDSEIDEIAEESGVDIGE